MKKLFLASYFAGTAQLLPDFMGEEIAGKKVVFIPTAALYPWVCEEKETLDELVSTDRAALQNIGLVVEELDVKNATNEAVTKSITNTDYIFVCGGDSFYLLQELRRKGADKLITEHIEKGKLYMGTSAGSLIMQKDIVDDGIEKPELATDLNGDFSALGIIDFYLYVHYGSHYWGDDDEYIRKFYDKLNYVKISDKQAVTVNGNDIKIVTAN
ncbi:MAG: Type 1 glutamine amidotransferase-like domain-containing protein [Firmicutes bacterium]|nr:Type 1 glutamine amidotransferase-like domain-containing protein [Bacillota bacterium]